MEDYYDPEILLKLYPAYDKVLGPYTRQDGRKQFVLNSSRLANGTKGKLRTISFPKAKVECLIERRLDDNETIDHLNRNKFDDRFDNLVILDREEHCSLDAKRVLIEDVNCIECSRKFPCPESHLSPAKDINGRYKAGPFCSRSCSGNYGSRLQNGGERKERTKITKKYYHQDKW